MVSKYARAQSQETHAWWSRRSMTRRVTARMVMVVTGALYLVVALVIVAAWWGR